MGKVIKVTAYGEVSTIEKNTKFFAYEDLKEMTYDLPWYEIVVTNMDRKYVMLVDEEGQLKRLPQNVIASAFYGTSPFDEIVGNVYFMVVAMGPEGPDVRTMTEDEYKYVMAEIEKVKEAIK